MTTLGVQLLGTFSIICDGKAQTTLTSPRLQSFFAYLLLHSQQVQVRQTIAFNLWPDSNEAQAQSNLRKALFQLRHALPNYQDFLQIDAHSIQWHPQALCTVDVFEFTAKLHAAQNNHLPDLTSKRQLLAEAVARYQGDLLPAAYDEWVIAERERLRQLLLEALEQLTWLCEDQRDYAAAIHHAHYLLRLDPLHESAYLQLMRLYALSGDRAAALQSYHTCVTTLQRELGVEPGELVQRAYEQLLSAAIPAATHPQPTFTPAELPRLVGRQAEWQQLRAAWQQTTQGHTRFCLIHGEAGIGKTRLGEELLHWTSRQGIATATTRSYEMEGALAYVPVAEWLRTPALQDTLQQLDPLWLSDVARLLPELLVKYPTLPKPTPLTDSWQQKRFFEALARAFVDDGQPKLLFIDDLQWCDGETLTWLRYLLHFARNSNTPQPKAPLLIVGTVRSSEVNEAHPLTSLLLDLRRNDEITELTLTPLNHRETAELAAQFGSGSLDEPKAEQLYQQSEGNPLFVVEMARTGFAAEEITPDHATNADPQTLPPKVHAVIHQRLAQLSPLARKLAGLAASIGRAFSYDVLATASDLDEAQLVSGLEELWQRRIIREQSDTSYDFSHDRIRETAYRELSQLQRRLWHRHIAEALEKLFADDLDTVSGQLAGHYEAAGMYQSALEWYRQAGQVAKDLFAHAEQASYLQAGLRILDQWPVSNSNTAQKIELLLELDAAMTNIYGLTSCRQFDVLLQAQKLARQVNDQRNLSDVLHSLTFIHLASGKPAQAEKLAQENLSLVEGIQDPFRAVSAYQSFGIVKTSQGSFKEANQILSHARTSLDHVDDQVRSEPQWMRQGTFVDRFWLNVLWASGFPTQAQNVALRLLTAAPQQRPIDRANNPFFLAMLYRHLKLNQQLAQQAELLIQMGEQYSMKLPQLSGMVFAGWALAGQGNYTEGIALTRRGVDSFRSAGQTIFQTHRLSMLAEMYLMNKQFEEAQSVLDEAFIISKEKGERYWDVELHRLQGDLLLRQAAPDTQVEKSYLSAIEVAQQQGAKSLELRATMHLCRLWQRQGKRQQAYDLLAAIYGWFTEGFDTHDLQAARALLEQLV